MGACAQRYAPHWKTRRAAANKTICRGAIRIRGRNVDIELLVGMIRKRDRPGSRTPFARPSPHRLGAVSRVPFPAAVAWTNSSSEVAVRTQRNPVTLGTEGNGTSASLRRAGSAARRNQSERRRGVEGVRKSASKWGKSRLLVPKAASHARPGIRRGNGCKSIASRAK